jgi:hypothetical protein
MWAIAPPRRLLPVTGLPTLAVAPAAHKAVILRRRGPIEEVDMRSWDPLRNFPELDGLPEAEARTLIRDTQKRISREPKILAGLIAVALAAGVVAFGILNLGGLLGGLVAGALIGIAVAVYMMLVIKPRMQNAFREMGYPKRH